MSFRKMVLVPEDVVNERPKEPISTDPPVPLPIKKKPDMDRFHKILKIVLKIALHNAYNEDFKVLDRYGHPVSESDIAALINHALSHQKLLIGEEDFVRILYESNVDPDWIVNENVKAKLLSYGRNTQSPPRSRPPRNPRSRTPSPPPLTHRYFPRDVTPPPALTPHGSPERYKRKRPIFSTDAERNINEIGRRIEGNSATVEKRLRETPAWDLLDESTEKKDTPVWDIPLPDDDDDDT